jgi:hypothetical protein
VKIKQRMIALVTLALAIGGVGVVSATSATAADAAHCWSGYACIWNEPSYSTGKYGVSLTQGTYYGTTHDNNAESASANGATCALTNFYTSTNRTYNASGMSGDHYFFLSSETLYTGEAWKDANLNGVYEIGYGQPSGVYDYNFNNKVSSWKFTQC